MFYQNIHNQKHKLSYGFQRIYLKISDEDKSTIIKLENTFNG